MSFPTIRHEVDASVAYAMNADDPVSAALADVSLTYKGQEGFDKIPEGHAIVVTITVEPLKFIC